MTEGVVDIFEVINIDHQQDDGGAGPLGFGECEPEPVHQQRAVRDSGQRVVKGPVLHLRCLPGQGILGFAQPPIGGLGSGDVASNVRQPQHRPGLIPHRRNCQRHLHRHPIGPEPDGLQLFDLPPCGYLGQDVLEFGR